MEIQYSDLKAYQSSAIFILYFSCLSFILYLSDYFISLYDLYPSCIDNCKIFVLNLDSSKDRLEYISKSLNTLGLTFERISAVNGNDLSFLSMDSMKDLSSDEVSENGLIKDKKLHVFHKEFPMCAFVFDYSFREYYVRKFKQMYQYKMSLGELGCYYSHRVIWQKVIDEDIPYVVVLEDDAKLVDNFINYINDLIKQMPLNADFILLERRLGCTAPAKKVGLLVKAVTKEGAKTLCSGTCGYLVTNQGAKKLLAFTYKAALPIDVIIPMLYFDEKINHYVASTDIVIHDSKFASIITLMGRSAYDEMCTEGELNKSGKPSRRKILERLLVIHRRLRRLKEKKVIL